MSGEQIAVIGSAVSADVALDRVLDRLLSDDDIRHVIYLGDDDVIGDVLAGRRKERLSRDEFLTRGVEVACGGGPDEIRALLTEHHATRRLGTVRRLPDAPAMAVEMLEKWILLLVRDRRELEEDDIANAHAIIYGKASKPAFKRFGPRCFFTPGPLTMGHFGRLELTESGDLDIHLVDLAGHVVSSERFESGGGQLSVTA